MNVIDSSGWLEYIHASQIGAVMKPIVLNHSELIVPSITIYEVTKKLLRERGEEYALAIASQMQQAKVIALDAELSILAADLSLKYRLPMADSIIYAAAQKSEAILWTTDAHFENLPDVRYFPKT
jgi:predicted nucleic acid-binding protein